MNSQIRHSRTAILTADAAGSELCCLSGFGLASHYYWRDPDHLLIWGDAGRGAELYLLADRTGQSKTVDAGFFLDDGHCSYSPDRRWILYDSYPVDDYRSLYIYDVKRGHGETLGMFYSPPDITGDIRCDLHPRWNRAGTMISFDSAHEGFRAMYSMDLSTWMSGANA